MNSIAIIQEVRIESLIPTKTTSEIVSDLYKSHNSWLQNWLRKKLGSSNDAADLMHDTFSRLLQKDDLTSINEPRAYLTTVAHGIVVNHFRKRDIERAYLNMLAEQPEAFSASTEDTTLVIEALVLIDEMLDGLTEKVRNAFLWFQLEGLTHKQIAEKLNVSVSSVRQYIAKALMHCVLATQ